MPVSLKHTTQAVGTDAGNGEIRKAQWNEEHTLTLSADKLLGRATSGAGAVEEIDCTAAGRALLDDADAAAQRATLGVSIGSAVQAWDADLDAISAITDTAGFLKKTAANTWSLDSTSYSAVGHIHAIADVTGLQSALDGKQASGSYAAASHTHAIADVTGLQTALDGKQASGSYAASSHTHAISDVTNLQTSLNSKLDAFPSGTRIVFHQDTAPTGWTKDTNPALNHALRLTGGTAGWGGSQAYTTIFANRYFEGWTSGNAINGWNGYTTLSWNEMPSHNHSTTFGSFNNTSQSGSGARINTSTSNLVSVTSSSAGASWGHVHGWGNDAHSHVTGAWFNMDVQYADVIICSKN